MDGESPRASGKGRWATFRGYSASKALRRPANFEDLISRVVLYCPDSLSMGWASSS